MSSDVLLDGLLRGRLPGNKEFSLYYLELTTSKFNIFEEQETEPRKCVHSMEIQESDTAGIESKVRKGELRFYFSHSVNGRYIFKVPSEASRDGWISKLRGVISKNRLESTDGFTRPSSNALHTDNVGPSQATPIKIDTPMTPLFLLGERGGRVGGASPQLNTIPRRGKLSPGGISSIVDSVLPPIPGGSMGIAKSYSTTVINPRVSTISTDSGIGTSAGGQVCRPPMHKSGSTSVPNSGSGTITRGGGGGGSDGGGSGGSGGSSGPHSADSQFKKRVTLSNIQTSESEEQEEQDTIGSKLHSRRKIPGEEKTPKWFWGIMSRQECEERLKSKGEMGNFVVRINATEHYIMSFWRIDGIHHHKILNHEGLWRFERAAVNAEGESLADLLDTYMKNCSRDKNIKPFGGGLFQNYTYAWNPPAFDMEVLSKKLKEQKKSNTPLRRQEYTEVELDSGMNAEETFENDSLLTTEPTEAKATPFKLKPTKDKPLPLLPIMKKMVNVEPSPSPRNACQPNACQPKRVAPPPPASKLKNKQNTASSPKPSGARGEVTKRKNSASRKVSESTPPLSISPKIHHSQKDSSLPSKTTSLSVEDNSGRGGGLGEAEPMYANTATGSQSLSQPIDNTRYYQNCDFKGPPLPLPDAPPLPLSNAATTDESSSVTAAAADENHYQNYNFQKKAAKKTHGAKNHSASTKAVKTLPRLASQEERKKSTSRVNGSASHANSSASHANSSVSYVDRSASHANSSASAEEGSMYENFVFRKS